MPLDSSRLLWHFVVLGLEGDSHGDRISVETQDQLEAMARQ